jgi:uncharacterized protein (TIGR02246 family)
VTKEATPSDIVRDLEVLWRTGDLDAMMKHVAEDAQFVVANGASWRGQQAIRDGFAQLRQFGPIDSKTEIVSERSVTPDVVIVTSSGDVAETRLPNGRILPPGRTLATVVLKRDHDRWLVTASHSSVFFSRR